MPLTAAEKQRRYRQRLKEKDSEAVKEKERQRWHRRKTAGKVKGINDLTPREQRSKRRQWQQWNKRRAAERRLRNDAMLVARDSDDMQNVMDVDLDETPTSSYISSTSQTLSRQALRGRKEKRKDRSSAYRKIASLEAEILRLKRTSCRYRQQASRAKKRKLRLASHSDVNRNHNEDTPRKKARKMSSDPKVRKTLKFHFAMMAELKQRYAELRKKRESAQVLAKLFGTAGIIRKYRMIKEAKKAFGLSRDALKRCEKRVVTTIKPEPVILRKRALDKNLLELVKSFYLREDVSRATAGKKETVTRMKVKKQKRFLLEPLCRTFKAFRLEHPKAVISLAAFRRLRPFWVVRPRIQDRDTCRCQTCDNISFMHDRLKQLDLLTELTPQMQFSKICCSIQNKDCMYRECKKCCKQEAVSLGSRANSIMTVSDVVCWWQWQSVSEMMGEKVIKKTKKIRVQGTVKDLVKAYNARMQYFTKHCYNIKHQFDVCKMKRESLAEDEVWLHIDFAENWCSKSLSEVQAAHFGGSHRQISLHTCVAYSGSFSSKRCICSISDNTNHAPLAVWHHLRPILVDLKTEFPHLRRLHVMSDGPVTQYRGRENMHLLANVPYDLGFKEVYWNFSEASHGKGAVDGVGAAVKRLCDNLVLSGKDLTDAGSVCNAISPLSKTQIYEISSDFTEICLPNQRIPAVTGSTSGILGMQRNYLHTRSKLLLQWQ